MSIPKGIAVTSARPVSSGQPPGQPRVAEISRQHPEGRSGNDPVEHEIRGEPEHADQEAGEHHQVREVVDGEAEERVHVPGRVPAVRGLRRAGSESSRTSLPRFRPLRRFRVWQPGARTGRPGRQPAARGGGEELPGAGPNALAQRRAPREARPPLGDLAEVELDRGRARRRGGAPVEGEAYPVGAALAGAVRCRGPPRCAGSRAWRASGRSPRARRRSRRSRRGCSDSCATQRWSARGRHAPRSGPEAWRSRAVPQEAGLSTR